jgi:hypothetical protein
MKASIFCNLKTLKSQQGWQNYGITIQPPPSKENKSVTTKEKQQPLNSGLKKTPNQQNSTITSKTGKKSATNYSLRTHISQMDEAYPHSSPSTPTHAIHLPFGAAAVSAEFCITSEIVCDVANALLQDKQWDTVAP